MRPTTVIEAPRLSDHLGLDLFIASETFQHTGSFKFRGAHHLASQVRQERIITASSGNFGQALARACQLLGKACVVVMPDASSRAKIEAVRAYGGEVQLINVAHISRADRLRQLAIENPDAYIASPYDDPLVIEGNSTLGRELANLKRGFENVLVPVGGGGLASGIIQGLRRHDPSKRVYGVEPELANDAARSLRAGQLLANEREAATIADGVRTLSLGRHNWPILREGLSSVVEVSEEHIKEAVRLLFLLANLKVEPTGALALAGLLSAPHLFRGSSVCCVASGGNVDPDLFCSILRG